MSCGSSAPGAPPTPTEAPHRAWQDDVQRVVAEFLADRRRLLTDLQPDVCVLVDHIENLMRGGKRLRAAFWMEAYTAAGGSHPAAALRAATSMEFFQAAALIHDDVMDASATRRGMPTIHEDLSMRHRRQKFSGDPARYGSGGAILAGNLCLVWSDDLFVDSGLPPEALHRARGVFEQMRTQLMGGQFLDLHVAASGWEGLDHSTRLERARRVVDYKSARYSVQQPTLMGALAGGLGSHQLPALGDYGLQVGEAFQLRDDLLGILGDPTSTGKPAGDDLREGKRTYVVALAARHLPDDEAQRLEAALGNPDLQDEDVERLVAAIARSGAVPAVESRIDALIADADAALDTCTDLSASGRARLRSLAHSAAYRCL